MKVTLITTSPAIRATVRGSTAPPWFVMGPVHFTGKHFVECGPVLQTRALTDPNLGQTKNIETIVMHQDRKQTGRQSKAHLLQGDEGEQLALLHLKRLGYRILCRNYRCPLGEIDIIAHHRDVLVFVEVKSRRSQTFGSPKQAITPAKQHKLSQVAWHYLQKHDLTEAKARFDVVTVSGTEKSPHFEVIENAFESTY